MTQRPAPRRVTLARPASAALLGGLLLALAVAAVPLSRLAHQSLNAGSGSVPVWISAAYGAVGVIIAWRKPGNPLGWVFLLGGFFSALSEDASFYMVVDYRLHHGGLPTIPLSVLANQNVDGLIGAGHEGPPYSRDHLGGAR